MPSLYARVFVQILDSSLAENWKTRHVFEDLLKLANQDGVIDMTHQSIARRTNMPPELISEALAALESPDPNSRDQDNEGRRIARLDDHRDWGWRVLNWQKYECIRVQNDMRTFNAIRMKNYRDRKHGVATPPTPPDPKTDPYPHPHPQGVGDIEPTCSLHTMQEALNLAYNRPSNAVWTYAEQCQLSELIRRDGIEQEWGVLTEYRKAEPKWFPRSISSLLSKWDETLDRARSKQPKDECRGISASMQASLDKTELERIEKQIGSVLNGYESHQSLTEQDRVKLTPLRQRRAELKERLGFKA